MTITDFIRQARERLDKAKSPSDVLLRNNISLTNDGLDLAHHAPTDLAVALSALEVAWEALENLKQYNYLHGEASKAQAEINRLLNEDKGE